MEALPPCPYSKRGRHEIGVISDAIARMAKR
jgi:hypothetical protein